MKDYYKVIERVVTEKVDLLVVECTWCDFQFGLDVKTLETASSYFCPYCNTGLVIRKV